MWPSKGKSACGQAQAAKLRSKEGACCTSKQVMLSNPPRRHNLNIATQTKPRRLQESAPASAYWVPNCVPAKIKGNKQAGCSTDVQTHSTNAPVSRCHTLAGALVETACSSMCSVRLCSLSASHCDMQNWRMSCQHTVAAALSAIQEQYCCLPSCMFISAASG